MRDLLRRMQPTGFEDIVAVIALYRPGPMGMNAHNDYADRKNGRQAIKPDPPGAGRTARGDPRRDLRPDRLPRADHAHRAEGRRLLARPEQTFCARPWARRSVRCSTRSTRASREGMKANGFSARPPSRRCGTPCFRSPTTRSTSRTPPATAWCRTGRPTSRPTIRPSTWPACSPRSATTRTRPRSTWPTAASWASPCCRRTSTSPG